MNKVFESDVLVVGGGLSGLSLANQLALSNTEFVLLEGRSRFGGRILSESIDGVGFDLGPAWFWPGQPRIERLIKKLSLDTFLQYAEGEQVWEDGQGQVQRNQGYASMDGSLRLAGGIGRLIDSLQSSLPESSLKANHRVTSIKHSEDGIETISKVNGEDHHFRSHSVVIAAPPRLIDQQISFLPTLGDSAQHALQSIPTWMAVQAKVIAVYDKPYWRTAGLSGDAMSQRGPMVEIHDASPISGGPFALFGFFGYPAQSRRQLQN